MAYISLDVQKLKQANSDLESSTNELVGTHFSNLQNCLTSLSSNIKNQGINGLLIGINNKLDTISTTITNDLKKITNFMTEQTTEYERSEDDILNRINAIITKVQQFNNASTSNGVGIFNNSNSQTSSNNSNNSGEQYDIPEGATYAKQLEPITALSQKKNADGSYYYKESAIAYGGTDSSGKTWNTQTEEGTGLRYVEEDGEKYYCAAMGTLYGQAGDKVKVTTDTGQTFNVIITDSKSVSDASTVQVDGKTYSQYHYWDSEVKDLVEFNCDYSKVPSNVKNMGSYHVLEQFSGNIVSIEPIN